MSCLPRLRSPIRPYIYIYFTLGNQPRVRKNQAETTHQYWPKQPRAETTRAETTQDRNDSGPKGPVTAEWNKSEMTLQCSQEHSKEGKVWCLNDMNTVSCHSNRDVNWRPLFRAIHPLGRLKNPTSVILLVACRLNLQKRWSVQCTPEVMTRNRSS